MKTSATNRRLRVLLTALGDGTLIPQPDFQRRLVWSNKDKLAFIKTVIEGYPFPEIYIAAGSVDSETGKGTELLVDGQQRITTLIQYFKAAADLRLSREITPYRDLSEQRKIEFLEYEVVVRDLGSHPIEIVKEIFQRINSTSYGLNAMEIHNARYGGEFKLFGDKLAQHPFFEKKGIFTANDVRRMNDTRYCLSLAITMLSAYFNRDGDLEDYLEKYNEHFDASEDLLAEANVVLSFIEKMDLDPQSRAWKKADFFSLFVELHRALIKHSLNLDVGITRNALLGFFEKVQSAADGKENEESDYWKYYKAALQASNDRSNRIERGAIIARILGAQYEPPANKPAEFDT